MRSCGTSSPHWWIIVLTLLALVAQACAHLGSSRSAGTVAYDPHGSRRPWLELEALRPFTVGVADQSQVTGDGALMFWTRSDNQALSLMWQEGPLAQRPSGSLLAGASEASPNTSAHVLFESTYDTSSPDWDAGGRRLVFLSYHKSARGQICVWSLPPSSRLPPERIAVDPEACFDHPGKVSQPLWGPGGKIYFLSHALPWDDATMDGLWQLDPRTRLSRQLASYPRLGSFAVHPQTGEIVAVGWPKLSVMGAGDELSLVPLFSRQNRPRLLYLESARRATPHSAAVVGESDGDKAWLPFELNVPGFPVGPRFDAASDSLHWGQFVDDSNDDARVDGDDGSVILSAAWSSLRRELANRGKNAPAGSFETDGVTAPIFVDKVPLQLTLGRDNCLFPRVVAGLLYVTCAPRLGGLGDVNDRLMRRLDIYSLPTTGLIPSSWTDDRLLEVRAEARNPSLQALLTNVWRNRQGSKADAATDRRALLDLVGIHWEAMEVHAAREVFEVWRRRAPSNEPLVGTRSEILAIVLEAAALRAGQASTSMSSDYREKLFDLTNRLERIKRDHGHSPTRAVRDELAWPLAVAAWYTNNGALQRPTGSGLRGPIAVRQLMDALSIQPLGQGAPSQRWADGLEELFYLAAARSVRAESEARILGDREAADLLALLASRVSAGGQKDRMALSFALAALARSRASWHRSGETKHGLPLLLGAVTSSFGDPMLDALQETQAALLKVLQAAQGEGVAVDENSREGYRSVYSKVEALLRPDDPRNRLIYRAHASLMAELLASSEQSLLFGYHASNWLARTPLRSYAYGVVLDFYRNVTFSRAYDAWSAGQLRPAADIFYGAVRLTRDEEAHLGFVLTALASGMSTSDLEGRYQSLLEALGASFSGQPVLRSLMALRRYDEEISQAPAETRDAAGEPAHLAEAMEALQEPQGSVPIVRDFVRGVVAHERYRRSLKASSRSLWSTVRPGGDPLQLEEAMTAYTLTLERVGFRPAMRASVAAALGQLNFLAGSGARAAGYMDRALQDLSDEAPQRGPWTLLLARALGRSGRPDAAYESLLAFEKLRGEPPWPWWHSVVAFYAGEAGKSDESCRRYGRSQVTNDNAKSRADGHAFRTWGQREHEAWACLGADSGVLQSDKVARGEESSRSLLILKEMASELGIGSASTGAPVTEARPSAGSQLPSLRVNPSATERNDFLDDDPYALRARVAGVLAQIEPDVASRVAWLKLRAQSLESVIRQGHRTGLSPRQARVFLAKACAESALLALRLSDDANFISGMECGTAALAELAGSEDARKKSGGLFISADEIEGLRFLGMLWIASPSSVSAQQRSLWAKSILAVFKVTFGASGGSKLTRTSGWGDELTFQYVQLGTVVRLVQLRSGTKSSGAAQDRALADEPDSFCQYAVGRPALEKLLPLKDVAAFDSAGSAAALESWCRGLFDFSLWHSEGF